MIQCVLRCFISYYLVCVLSDIKSDVTARTVRRGCSMCSTRDISATVTPIDVKVCLTVSGHKVSSFGGNIFRVTKYETKKMKGGRFWGF